MAKRRRSKQQLVDEATRLVLAYNRAVLLDDNAPSVAISIGPKTPPVIYITPDRYDVCCYGGGSLVRGHTFKDGIAHVKELLHEHRESERHEQESRP